MREDVIVIDFETEAIQARPAYPPKPVGYSIKRPGQRKSKYYSWGHPEDNNCHKSEAERELRDAWRSKTPLLFHNGKFDVDVAQTHMGMGRLPWERCEDTLYLLFLDNPHALNLSLKPSAERLLEMPSTERDAVKDWILKNVPGARRSPKEWGAHISKAPGKLVGEYADGDVLRTEKLFYHLKKDILKRNMGAAYDRERKLMPILLDNEREGIRIDWDRLEKDYEIYKVCLEAAENWLRKTLHAPDLDFNQKAEVGEVLNREGIVTEWVYTKTGKRSVAKKNLSLKSFNKAKVASVYGYVMRLHTCISMFFEPWLAMARISKGIVYTNWNQVRQAHGAEKFKGARTGRLSSNPNFQNIPKNWKKAIAEGYIPPEFLPQLVPLPLMRSYFLPDGKDCLWGRRDYNQQELRITAHYEDGDLCRRYNEDPRFDLHALVQKGIKDVAGIELIRDHTKVVNFQDIYGGGKTALALALEISHEMAGKIKAAKRALMPDFAELESNVKAVGESGEAIFTWGGREYYAEEPKYSGKFGRVMSFAYKLLNYLIQGSAADCTKESIIRYHNHPKRQGRFLLTVHDENNISAHKKVFKQEMELLRQVMQSVEFDVPMLSDGEYGPNWGALSPFKDVEVKPKRMVAVAGK